MSLTRALPVIRPVAPRRHLRPVPSTPSTRRPATRQVTFTETRVRPAIITKLIGGIVAVLMLNFFVSVMCNSAIYSISELKKERDTLATQTQILEQQVDSLRSPQNLANSADALGMVPNSNPVFLKVATGKVLGVAKPAPQRTVSGQYANLVSNSALIAKSNPTKATSSKIEIPVIAGQVSPSVKTGSKGLTEVVLPSSGIPASPTH